MGARKHMSTSIRLDAALNALGLLGLEIQWDHNPPLGLREKITDEAGNVIGYIPDENDPRYIVPMVKQAHRDKTNGKKHDVSNGDIHKIAKASRLSKAQEEFRQRVANPEPREPRPKSRMRHKRKSEPNPATAPLTKICNRRIP